MDERQVKKKINSKRKFDLSELSCAAGEFSPFDVYAQYLSLGQAGGQRTSRDERGEQAPLKLHDRREELAKAIACGKEPGHA